VSGVKNSQKDNSFFPFYQLLKVNYTTTAGIMHTAFIIFLKSPK